MAKRETPLKAALMLTIKERLPLFFAFRHEDKFTSGIPDISVTARKHTSWWEVKHATPDFDSEGLQELTMRRYAEHSYHARYIIYFEDAWGRGKRTLIVHPDNLHLMIPEHAANGFDHQFVARVIQAVHWR